MERPVRAGEEFHPGGREKYTSKENPDGDKIRVLGLALPAAGLPLYLGSTHAHNASTLLRRFAPRFEKAQDFTRSIELLRRNPSREGYLQFRGQMRAFQSAKEFRFQARKDCLECVQSVELSIALFLY